jgi:hypothetical protein
MDKAAQIEDARRRDVCPNCGERLGTERVGSGSHSDGVFCSLECISRFHADYFEERRDYGNPSVN